MIEDSSLLRYAVKIGKYLATVKTREMQAPWKISNILPTDKV